MVQSIQEMICGVIRIGAGMEAHEPLVATFMRGGDRNEMP